jgi:Rv2525c-like, glycoside hydrolase-like domain
MSDPVKGCDYSTAKPRISALKPDGISFVVRYLSPGANPKNLTKPELTALLAAGLSVAVVFESYAGRMKGGRDAGAADAMSADATLRELGLTGLPCYFAADWDVQPAELAACDAYLDGVAATIGGARTGVYGGFRVVHHSLDAGKAAFAWQTYAWSLAASTLPPHTVKVQVPGDTRWFMFDTRADLRQVRNGVPLAGGTVDLDEAHADDYGQWPRPAAVTGPFRHVVPAGNTLTLFKVAQDRGTTVDHIAEVTAANASPEHVATLTAYLELCTRLRAQDSPRAAMPEGLVYWTSNE